MIQGQVRFLNCSNISPENVKVVFTRQIKLPGGSGGEVIAETVTNKNGFYQFDLEEPIPTRLSANSNVIGYHIDAGFGGYEAYCGNEFLNQFTVSFTPQKTVEKVDIGINLGALIFIQAIDDPGIRYQTTEQYSLSGDFYIYPSNSNNPFSCFASRPFSETNTWIIHAAPQSDVLLKYSLFDWNSKAIFKADSIRVDLSSCDTTFWQIKF